MSTWRLLDYDVWGNEKDGYEVNEAIPILTGITITDDATDKEIVTYLYNVRYLKTKDMRKIRLENDTDWIEIYQKKGNLPLGRLEVEYDKA